jgi:hypothetical protein
VIFDADVFNERGFRRDASIFALQIEDVNRQNKTQKRHLNANPYMRHVGYN